MLGTQALLNASALALSLDTNSLAEVAKCLLILAKNSFTPGLNTVIGDLTEADFDGYAGIAVGTGLVRVYIDPATGENIIEMIPPLGGWHWVTTGITNLPQTIYGYALTDSTKAKVWGSGLLSAPLLLTASGQGLDVDEANFRLISGALT